MSSFGYVDHLLRNPKQVTTDVQDDKKVRYNTSACFRVFVGLSVFYGLVMGCHGLIHGRPEGWKYAVAGAVKLPLLFLLTLAICLPLLYVLNVLIGPRVGFRALLGLLIASISATGIVLASFALIVLFFAFSTSNYHFIKLLNAGVFVVAGFYGVWYLRSGIRQVSVDLTDDEDVRPSRLEPGEQSELGPGELPELGPGEGAGKGTETIVTWWLVTYGIVGAQMAWLMRPFIGNPELPFAVLRGHGSNIYISILNSIGKLMGVS